MAAKIKVDAHIAIIGGGPAGLSAATTLAEQQCHKVFLFDKGTPPNSSKQLYMVPGFCGNAWMTGWKLEGEALQGYREAVGAQFSKRPRTHDITFHQQNITKIEKDGDFSFIVYADNEDAWKVFKVILAVGCYEVPPPIVGSASLWRKGIYPSLYAYGNVQAGKEGFPGGILVRSLATPAVETIQAVGHAKQLRHWDGNGKITIFTNGQDDSEQYEAKLRAIAPDLPFEVDSRKISQLKDAEDRIHVYLGENKTLREVGFLVYDPPTSSGSFAGQLGLNVTATGNIAAYHPFYQTIVRGVFAAGDCITADRSIPHASSSGHYAAIAAMKQLHGDLYEFQSVVDQAGYWAD